MHPRKESHRLSSDKYPNSNIDLEIDNMAVVSVAQLDSMFTDKSFPTVIDLGDSVKIRQYDEDNQNTGNNFFDAFRTNGFKDATNFDDYYFTRSTDGRGDLGQLASYLKRGERDETKRIATRIN
ncbi:hypothetical protein RF11_08646 [Thelohanellus kitauei]|uniref:Uncharacterized protein n=1 Tax=Thelohanellus kitauei TaxID=669202 RepID=A0A0C2MY36_THEKT|nr:hypothetical protein RF11_08646 [Thelohanellus kitauei]